jgi:hypothetical protein
MSHEVTVDDDAPESDAITSNLSRSQLHDQFPVVKSEQEMVHLMRKMLKSGLKFDVIITPFGCDSKSLPPSILKLLEEEDSESDVLPPKAAQQRVSTAAGSVPHKALPPPPRCI